MFVGMFDLSLNSDFHMVNTGMFGHLIIISCPSFCAKTEPDHDDRKRMGMKVMLKLEQNASFSDIFTVKNAEITDSLM